MLKILAFLFIVVPLAEIVVLVEVGSFVGVAGTLGLVV
ncbi:MAG TPA: exlusion protein FxsA, partial [Gammaproteobacteria bacterium]|nr:exlusion protein FxsA [Gammaproteobacteria bacterium]